MGWFRWVYAIMLPLAATGCTHLADNVRVVDDDAFYRSGQMSGRHLAATIEHYGIRTVINFRGVHPEEQWYRTERDVCAEHDVAHHDLEWSMNALPTPESLAQYLAWIEAADRPILVHCQGGTHRAGVASACYLLQQGADVDTARGQFGIFFGDAPIGELLDLYQDSALPFAEWVETQYPARYDEATQDEEKPA